MFYLSGKGLCAVFIPPYAISDKGFKKLLTSSEPHTIAQQNINKNNLYDRVEPYKYVQFFYVQFYKYVQELTNIQFFYYFFIF